jgi:hypothetical protein
MRWVVLALPLLGGAAQAEPAPSSPAAASPGYSLGQGHSTPLPDGAALDLVWIKPGTFLMGSPDGEAGHQQSEQPRTTVTISRGFWMGKTHVTQRQYQAVMGTNPSHFVNAGPEAPVERVSWDEAMEFCRRLTEQERTAGRIPEGYAYTLPTAAQWEYSLPRRHDRTPVRRPGRHCLVQGQQRRHHASGRPEAAECLRALRHDRQSLGVVRGLVVGRIPWRKRG